jgi:hypothetical protein
MNLTQVKVTSLDFTYQISVSLWVLCCNQSKNKTLHTNTKLQQLLLLRSYTSDKEQLVLISPAKLCAEESSSTGSGSKCYV